MHKKIGRPKLDTTKEDVLRVRLTKKEKEALNKYCKDNDICKSDLIREILFDNGKIIISNVITATNTLINKK